jgi:hypothetical protein
MPGAGTFLAPIHGGSYFSVFSQLPKEYAIHGFCEKIGDPAPGMQFARATLTLLVRVAGRDYLMI